MTVRTFHVAWALFAFVLQAAVPEAGAGVRALAKRLDAAPLAEKALLIRALGASKSKRAVRELGRRFDIRKAPPEVSLAMIRAFGNLENQNATDSLLEAWEYLDKLRFLSSGLPDRLVPLRSALPEALGRIGDIKAIPYLRRGMSDEDSRVVQNSVEALGRIRDMRSADWMIRLLSSADQNTAQSAYEALGLLGGEKAASTLREATKSRDAYVRVMASYGLARMGRKIGYLLLDGFLEEVEEPYKEGILAAYYLGRLGRLNGIDYLVRITRDKSSSLRPVAVEALGKTREVRAARPLTELLGDKDTGIRLMAVMALGRIGGSRAQRGLKKARKSDPNPGVRSAARTSLASLGVYSPP